MRLVECQYPDYVAFYAITLFSGIRADKDDGEALRLLNAVKNGGWSRHFIKPGLLLVPCGKVDGVPRDAYLPDNLRVWLDAYPQSVAIPHRCWHTRHVSKPLGLPTNYARHTAASCYIASGGSLGTASILFGNSEAILKRDYVSLVSAAEARKFYAIFPKKVAVAAA